MLGTLRGFFGLNKDGRSKRTPTESAQAGTRPYFDAVQQVCRAPPTQARRVRAHGACVRYARARAARARRAHSADARARARVLIRLMPARTRAEARTGQQR